MWLPKSKHGKYKTCSDVCKTQKEAQQKTARSKLCLTCKTLFTPRASQLRMGHGVYCSQACNEKSHQAMNTTEARQKAVDNSNQTRKINSHLLKGRNNPNWKGGKEEAKKRQREYVSLYKKINKDKVNVWSQNRRNRTVGTLSTNIVEKLHNMQLGQCAICSTSLVAYHIDHIIPLSRGGLNVDSNVQLTCAPCNLTKGSKLMNEINIKKFDELDGLAVTIERLMAS